MKRLLLALAATAAVAMLAAPVMAATQWNFGASLRYSTFWTQVDYGKVKGPDIEGGGATVSSDHDLSWGTQGNSRIKMFMKSEHLEGFIEMGWNTEENKVTTREYWGRYRFNEMTNIQIGQIHQLFNTIGLSNQVWSDDMNLHSIGVSWNPPTPKIVLSSGGFSFALSKPYSISNSSVWGADVLTTGGLYPLTIADVDTYFPQLQASYQYQADTWRVKLAGAYQHTKVKKFQVFDAATMLYSDTRSKNLHSWLISIDGNINFGPLYLAAAGSVGQNWSDAQWNTTRGGLGNDYAKTKSVGMSGINFENGSIKNTESVMGALIVGYRLTESLRFELGGGYRYDDNDAWSKSSNMWNVYLQAAYSVAPGFSITPEIGYVNLGKTVSYRLDSDRGRDAGYIWYAGAKWQMDF